MLFLEPSRFFCGSWCPEDAVSLQWMRLRAGQITSRWSRQSFSLIKQAHRGSVQVPLTFALCNGDEGFPWIQVSGVLAEGQASSWPPKLMKRRAMGFCMLRILDSISIVFRFICVLHSLAVRPKTIWPLFSCLLLFESDNYCHYWYSRRVITEVILSLVTKTGENIGDCTQIDCAKRFELHSWCYTVHNVSKNFSTSLLGCFVFSLVQMNFDFGSTFYHSSLWPPILFATINQWRQCVTPAPVPVSSRCWHWRLVCGPTPRREDRLFPVFLWKIETAWRDQRPAGESQCHVLSFSTSIELWKWTPRWPFTAFFSM